MWHYLVLSKLELGLTGSTRYPSSFTLVFVNDSQQATPLHFKKFSVLSGQKKNPTPSLLGLLSGKGRGSAYNKYYHQSQFQMDSQLSILASPANQGESSVIHSVTCHHSEALD
jgi:hypothetical protein